MPSCLEGAVQSSKWQSSQISRQSRRWAEYGNGMNEYRSYSLWQTRLLASYNKILKQLLVGKMDYHSLDQVQ